MFKHALLLVCASLLLSGCADNFSNDSYEHTAVGDINAVYMGRVIAKRLVNVEGDNSPGAGALLGGAGGALAGSAFGKGSGKVLGALTGAAVGGLAGHAIQKNATKTKCIEYIVKLDSGAEIMIIQGTENQLEIGQRCRVINAGHGKRSRIVAA